MFSTRTVVERADDSDALVSDFFWAEHGSTLNTTFLKLSYAQSQSDYDMDYTCQGANCCSSPEDHSFPDSLSELRRVVRQSNATDATQRVNSSLRSPGNLAVRVSLGAQPIPGEPTEMRKDRPPIVAPSGAHDFAHVWVSYIRLSACTVAMHLLFLNGRNLSRASHDLCQAPAA